jgi:hypothetical protein
LVPLESGWIPGRPTLRSGLKRLIFTTSTPGTTWYDTGEWKVWQNNDEVRGPNCQIQTVVNTTTGQAWIGVGANARTHQVLLMWGEPNWRWNSNQASFTVRIDNYQTRSLVMQQFSNMPGVVVAQLSGDPAIQFINELYAGSMLTIHTGSGDRKFPMVASKGAMTAMGQCMNAINNAPDRLPSAITPVQPHAPLPRVAAPAPSVADVAKQLN